jgi:hypothetical protein
MPYAGIGFFMHPPENTSDNRIEKYWIHATQEPTHDKIRGG